MYNFHLIGCFFNGVRTILITQQGLNWIKVKNTNEIYTRDNLYIIIYNNITECSSDALFMHKQSVVCKLCKTFSRDIYLHVYSPYIQ